MNDYLNSGVPVPNSYKQIRKDGILAANQAPRSRSENQGGPGPSASQK